MSKRFGETFEDLYSMKEQMDKLFRTSLERIDSEGEDNQGQWFPPVDMYDNGLDYVLEIEVPGVKQEDLEVLLLPDAIRLKGKRRFLGNVEQEKIFRLERPSGAFDRQFKFPGKVDTDHVQATLTDGILTLMVPKVGEKQKKTVSIKRSID
ncbi:MAG: Hsp20/alpha crystallin family protein [Pseudomonadota bacterium]|nr:Hsp20/alpha crystallin family protein [Pseudomonadota bacterium]